MRLKNEVKLFKRASRSQARLYPRAQNSHVESGRVVIGVLAAGFDVFLTVCRWSSFARFHQISAQTPFYARPDPTACLSQLFYLRLLFYLIFCIFHWLSISTSLFLANLVTCFFSVSCLLFCPSLSDDFADSGHFFISRYGTNVFCLLSFSSFSLGFLW